MTKRKKDTAEAIVRDLAKWDGYVALRVRADQDGMVWYLRPKELNKLRDRAQDLRASSRKGREK